jgi:large subunit ribosomal protein L7/L12|tara:strand:- start:15887 stop:16261 length:375 start_codon:yes stop_codon:yes gene_type:complete
MAEIDNLVEQLGKLTVVEAGELAKKLEKAWGLNYEEILGAGGSGVPVASQEEVKDTATVTLTGFADGQKIPIIKAVRPILDLGLLEAKNFVEDLPKVIKEDIEKEEAEKLKKILEEAGGTVQLK